MDEATSAAFIGGMVQSGSAVSGGSELEEVTGSMLVGGSVG